MKVLVINAGSSSVKFSVFDMDLWTQAFKSEIERTASLEDAIRSIPSLLEEKSFTSFDAVGHRVAHGGAKFHDACLISVDVLKDIEDCVPLAPLHNPPALVGIKVA